MQITKESWESSEAQDTITSDAPIAPKVNQTYNYSITLEAKDGWAFNTEPAGTLPFGLIVGGTEVDIEESYVSATVSDDGKLATIVFMSDPVAPVAVRPIDISGGATGASISAPVELI